MKIKLEYCFSLGKWVVALYSGRELITVLDARDGEFEGAIFNG